MHPNPDVAKALETLRRESDEMAGDAEAALGLLEQDHYWGETPVALDALGRKTALESLRARGFRPRTSPLAD